MTLARYLIDRFSNHAGGPEHRQISALVSKAKAYALDDDVVSALVWTLSNETLAVEKNLDCLLPPKAEEPIWIEFSNGPRNAASTSENKGGADPVRVGYLYSCDGLSDKISLVTAWSLPDTEQGTPVMHSLAIGHMSTDQFGLQAFESRNLLSQIPREAIERIVDSAIVAVPPNFEQEIAIMADAGDVSKAVFQCRHDLVSEIPFALAALIAVVGGACRIADLDLETAQHPVSLPPRRVSFLRRGAERLRLVKPERGLRRVGPFEDMKVAWNLPEDFRNVGSDQTASAYLPNEGAISSANDSTGGQDSSSSKLKSA